MPRWLVWAAVWFAIVLVAVKACYLGVPRVPGLGDYFRSLAAISYRDVLFVTAAWAVARAALALAGGRPLIARIIVSGFVGLAALTCLYVVASVVAFGVLGGFPTYALLQLVGSVRMLSSSVTVYLTPRIVFGLVGVPLTYVGLVWATLRWAPPASGPRWPRAGIACAVLGIWVGVGHYVYATDWANHNDWRIVENPPWVLASSWGQAMRGERTVRLAQTFAAIDLADFEPIGLRSPGVVPAVFRPRSTTPAKRRSVLPAAVRRPPNVILVVLESVAARWTSVGGGLYDTTPNLKAEASRGLVFDNFYAHVGRSSNSLASMLLSTYPKLDFRDFTEEFPRTTRTSLASLFRDRGYRTAFMTPSDMSWAGWRDFVQTRGFTDVRDDHDLPCGEPVSSWGVEDRCLVDGMIHFIDQEPTRPFFMMGWTQQTHHPYEPTPGVPLLELMREPAMPDAWELGRYLNVLHETDRQLERLFEAVRRHQLADDTLIVVVGDHGQAFGFPHNSYMQGRTAYEEDVRVPLLFWLPRDYRTATRSPTVGGQVDLAPTIADLAGVPLAPDWQGRSLFDPKHAPRAYFYVAQNEFMLGVREGNWKYILDLRAGAEELFDLEHDPNEQRNLAATQPERSARLRQHLAAWTEANRRQYD